MMGVIMTEKGVLRDKQVIHWTQALLAASPAAVSPTLGLALFRLSNDAIGQPLFISAVETHSTAGNTTAFY